MSDYLSEEEQLAQLKSWWSENGKLLLVALALALIVALGWRWYQTDRAKKIESGSSIYAQFLEADEDVRGALAQELADTASGTAYPVLAQLSLAQQALSKQGAAAAKPFLETALELNDDDELNDLIQLRLAKVEQQQGDSEAALGALANVRGTGYRSLVAELKGDIHMARNERALAHEAYSAALEAVSEGERRPVLALKANTTAAALSTAVDSAAATETESASAAADAADTVVESPAEADADNG